MFGGDSRVTIAEKHIPDYQEQLANSIFAAGWGWGGRMKFSVIHGCIPVIIQDGIEVEFEEQLPMHKYALRVPLKGYCWWLAHKFPEVLEVLIRKGIVAKMQKVLDCVWRLHWWTHPHGRAFELVMCELKRRLLGADSIIVDTEACTLQCGDEKVVNIINGAYGV
ncbi:hypothetical protein CEUSTIGMA_g10515.t1 [Chlamydomonas eustigma]|uniref:Uncharacterized protein n=1 Tax=Chlamydomonas eustigma TaxID=1157962 RepID=A0A250XJI8_9CHLO|nr:hypothetical protein CEUSTIGMA_g10515.t1 [Chlamydomonas eustigma]|eukprot:GAX83089.1 hypothetical protein CEUSTIGMA_g10515.t1 [Chlamydomonas eustigma]